jgi:1,4-alpha-glucan branching enzyme
VDGTRLICVENFAATARRDCRIGVPAPGPWRVVLDTDLAEYGGSRTTQRPPLTATPGQPCTLDLAALSVLWLTDSPCGPADSGNLPK